MEDCESEEPGVAADERPEEQPKAPRGWLARHRTALVVTTLGLALVCGLSYKAWDDARTANAKADEASVISDVATAQEELAASVEDAWGPLSWADTDVADPTVLSNLHAVYDDSSHTLKVSVAHSDDDARYDAVTAVVANDETVADDVTEATDKLNAAIDVARASKRSLAETNAKTALQAAVDSATTTLSDSEGNVADDATRTALQAAIDRTQGVTAVSALSDTSTIEGYTTDVQTAEAAVTASVQAKQEADAAAAHKASAARYSSKADASAAASSGGSVKQSSDGTWYVDYSVAYGSTPSFSDGGVYEYEPGYYIAHRSTGSNGNRIAALGEGDTVSVNGKTYVYAGEETVAIGSDYAPVDSWVHSDGGIGFQTCTGDGNAVVKKMVPVD